MKTQITILFLLLLTINVYSQNYNDFVSDSIVNELLIAEIDNRPKTNDDQKLWKKRINANPVPWTEAMIKLISSPPYDFEFQITEIINNDRFYKSDLKKITDLFTESDFTYMEKQFNTEQKKEWNFNPEKGRFKKKPKRKYYSYSIPLFDESRTKAIMYFEFGGCSVCGGARMLVYIKKDGKWELHKSIPLWDS